MITFRDVLIKTSWDNVREALFSFYPRQEVSINYHKGYKKVYKTFRFIGKQQLG